MPTCAIQREIDKGTGFDSNHIYYKLILYGIKSANASPQNFKWPDEIIDFINSKESTGGESTCKLLRGPGQFRSSQNPEHPNGCNQPFWSKINIPIPSKTTRQRRKPEQIITNGVLRENVVNFLAICKETTPFTANQKVYVTPVCLSHDGMAIKPSGDYWYD